MAASHDRNAGGFQAIALILALGVTSVYGQEKEQAVPSEGPVRMGDPEVIWDSSPAENPSAAAIPEASPTAPESALAGKTAEETVRNLLASVRPGDAYPEQYQRMLNLKDAAVPTLVQVLAESSSPWETRWFAAMALGRIGGARAREALEASVSDPLFLIRLAAVQALKIMGDASSAAVIRQALSDKAMVVRAAAADAAGSLKDPLALPILQEELFHSRNFYRGKSLWARAHIVNALVQIGSETSVPALIRLLRDADPELRSQACEALERIVSKPPVPQNVATSCETRWLAWYQRPR